MRDLAILAPTYRDDCQTIGTWRRSICGLGVAAAQHQLLILNRSRARAPNLRSVDRIIASLCAGLMRPARLLRSAIALKPSTPYCLKIPSSGRLSMIEVEYSTESLPALYSTT
jgi:hypothetical protein